MDLKKPAILSISLLTVMTNAAVAPLLGLISKSFPEVGKTLIKQIVTLPSLMIIIFSVISGQLVHYFSKKRVLAIGLCTYAIGGISAFWASSITSLLISRSIIGAGAGLIVPLGAAFITDFYSGEERAEMVGYSTFTSYFGAAIAPLASGWFVDTKWQNAFFIYLIAIAVLIMTMIFIPSVKKKGKKTKVNQKQNVGFSVIKVALLGCGVYTLFYLIPTDISFLVQMNENTDATYAATLLAIEILAAASAGVLFSRVTHKLGLYAFTAGLSFLAGGFLLINFASSFAMLILCVIIIGLGIGTIRPMVYLRTSQVSSPESMTTAFALVNSGFSLGQFISPFFYFGISTFIPAELSTGSYITAAVIFSIAAVFSLLLLAAKSRRNSNSTL